MTYAHGNLIEQIKRHEGFRAKPYKCTADKLTIGYGLNLDAGISESLASDILYSQLDSIAFDLSNQQFFANLDNPARKSVMINMVFNIGLTGVLKFAKMINAINLKDYGLAAKEMLDSKWAKQVGNRAIELAEQMKTGQWQ